MTNHSPVQTKKSTSLFEVLEGDSSSISFEKDIILKPIAGPNGIIGFLHSDYAEYVASILSLQSLLPNTEKSTPNSDVLAFKTKMDNKLSSINENIIFYDYIEFWEDEGTHRYLCDIETYPNGEVLENVLGLVSENKEEVLEFAKNVRLILSNYSNFESLNMEIKILNC